MYKVFMNDKPIILTDSPQREIGFEVYDFETVVLDEILHRLKKDKIDGIILFCENLQSCWRVFASHFKVVRAAGGLVVNPAKEFLFIYRGNKWDLPKGRIEKNESVESTAIREVEEECGIEGLHLDRFLLTTYHLFFQNNQNKLKVTDWFLMHSNYKGQLVPQIEEGITIAEFKDQKATQQALKNTYANIHLVFDAYAD
ncbi:NUDIX hydrolase [Pseudotenacibaculum haliotis]|uniref:NUDIX hydrolase n=1 Tax=Pseudotenacibaculum haliotis TaxID=1862138 RepID=A0ABW5LPV0_9FLAO